MKTTNTLNTLKALSLNLETLRDLTPQEAIAINGGMAQPTSSARPQPTGPVFQPTSSVRPTHGTVVTAPTPVHHKKHHHHH